MAKERFYVYLTPTEAAAFKKAAASEGKPASVKAAELMRLYLDNKFLDEIDTRVKFQQRIEELFSNANKGLATTLRSYEKLTVRAAAFAVACWGELAKSLSPTERQRVLKEAYASLHKEFESLLEAEGKAEAKEKHKLELGRRV